MKTQFTNFLLISGLAIAPNFTIAQTVIIDGTDGGNGYTLNGSFESVGADGTGAGGLGRSIDLWQTGFNADIEQARDNLAGTDGTYSVVLGSQTGTGDIFGVLLNTGYTVASGDTFDLSFNWRSAANWDSADSVDWRLFTTDDNTTSGSVTVIASGSESGFSDGVYRLVDEEGIGTVSAPNVGQSLWIEFYSATASLNGVMDGEFARLDEVNLTVTTIPEPSFFAGMAGLLGLAIVAWRRRG